MNIKDKIVVITGATGGIGRELVKKLDVEGAKLILVSKTESELQNLIKSLKSENHSYYVGDLSNQEEVQSVLNKISTENPVVNILLNCAGIGIYKPVDEISIDEWNQSFNINATSSFLFIKNLLPNLSLDDKSLVLSIGSGAGVIPMSGRSLYCATKFALRGFVLSLAEEYARIGKPKFCLITLGSTLTSFGPMSFEEKEREMEKGKAYFTPEWVSEKLLEIIKDENRETEYTFYPGDYGFGEWKKPEPLV